MLDWSVFHSLAGTIDPSNCSDPTIQKYLEDYYSLDYEDIVGGIPTRFKYEPLLRTLSCLFAIIIQSTVGRLRDLFCKAELF